MQQIHTVKGNNSCIANNPEKIISFGIGQLKFIDSFQFLVSPLEKLVNVTDKSSFKLTAQEFKQETDIILRKGVYPYE